MAAGKPWSYIEREVQTLRVMNSRARRPARMSHGVYLFGKNLGEKEV